MIGPLKKGVTVLISTKNGSSRLPATLKFLAAQKVNETLTWEIILINNGSVDNSKDVARQVWADYNTGVPLLIVNQHQPGKDKAIDLGLALAKFNYSIICDDDNWLDENYIQISFDIMSANDQIGLLGGQGIPVFEIDPPAWFSNFESYYAVGKQAEVPGELSTDASTLTAINFLWGAGSVINMRVYRLLVDCGFKRIITHDRHPHISRCEDLEISMAIQLTGYKLWYNNALIYKHFISKEKLNWTYLINITKPGSIVRPYLLLYNALRFIDPGKHEAQLYKKNWSEYKKCWIRYMINSNFSFKSLKYFFNLLFQRHIDGDEIYHRKVALWYEFISIIWFDRQYENIFPQLIELKKSINKTSIMV